ncbi:MAG: hypothetical protein WB699_07305 [Bacteroidota bacterium]
MNLEKLIHKLPFAVLPVTLLFGSIEETVAQDLSAFTKASGPAQVLLVWPADTTSSTLVRYNIYRKPGGAPLYPSSPLNPTPIAPITDCTAFKAVIPGGSADWEMLAAAFSDSATHLPLANVCAITSYLKFSPDWTKALIFARSRPSVARVMGIGFLDVGVVMANTYTYQIRRVLLDGTEAPLIGANEKTITVGSPASIPTPANVRLVVGDAKLQILWDKPSPEFSPFNVYRALSMGGPYRRVNMPDMSIDISRDLDSALVSPPANGFTDYERWDSVGNPAPRSVPGVAGTFTGPSNGIRYYYKVTHKDILGNEGGFSSIVNGVPVDKTPPGTPNTIIVNPLESTSSFEIRWPRVDRDIDGHKEQTKSYRVYRYVSGENPNTGASFVGSAPHPGPTDSTRWLRVVDATAGLRSACRDSTLYFRVEAVDSNGNVSTRSAAVGGALKDTTRPKNVTGTNAEGFDDYIRVKWNLNNDCDIDRYLIYRALCDYGDWIPCPDSTKRRPNGAAEKTPQQNPPKPGKPSACGGPFVLVGVMTQEEAKARGNPTYFDDHSIPAGSPICYSYLIKAQDLSQNISGSMPVPDKTKEIIVCQRLRDRTPPEPGIISGLWARDSAIVVEIIGPPIQDIAAYHIYRSETGEHGAYGWVGGMKIVPPPGSNIVLTTPYKAPATVGCNTIPLVSNDYMSQVTFVDKKAEPRRIYWYKALGIDQSGNETPVDSAMAISTFTFARNRESGPEITAVTATDNPCALTLTWTPGYDSTSMSGFVVFRGMAQAGPYYQVNSVVRTNTLVDNSVARTVSYWYRVAYLKKTGGASGLSAPKSGSHP